MTPGIQPADLGFFSTLVSAGSLTAAARELKVTTPAVSKRLTAMEARLGVGLVNRTTRRMSLTAEGETYLAQARAILAQIGDLAQSLGGARGTPSGLLRVHATLGFGRSHVGPLVGRFVAMHPQVQVQLQLAVDPPPLSDDAFDVSIRFGAPPDARVIARRLAPNARLLCAAPAYLARHGEPRSPAELGRHNVISIRQGDDAYGVLRLARGRMGTPETIKTRGNLTTNDGGIAVHWALEGLGILLRAQWDIQEYLDDGRLVQLLAAWHAPNADIHAIYPARQQGSARVRAFVEFLAQAFAQMPAHPA